MSERGFSRRAVAIGGSIAAALGIAALGITVPRLFRHHYRESAYDDLFAQLVDRDAAVLVGRKAIEEHNQIPVVIDHPRPLDADEIAKTLRQRMDRRTLAEVTNSDLAESKLAEIAGWVLPQTVALLCVLAALES